MMRALIDHMRHGHSWLVLILACSLSACVLPTTRENIDDLSALQPNETIIVGRVEIVPPLTKEEAKVKGVLNSSSIENKMVLLTDDHMRKVTIPPELNDYEGAISADIGKTMFVKSSNQPFYILKGLAYIQDLQQIYFPAGMKVNVRKSDKAIYIGTIRYNRDDFFTITNVSIIDDFDRANREFRKKFGSRYKLRKAIPVASR